METERLISIIETTHMNYCREVKDIQKSLETGSFTGMIIAACAKTRSLAVFGLGLATLSAAMDAFISNSKSSIHSFETAMDCRGLRAKFLMARLDKNTTTEQIDVLQAEFDRLQNVKFIDPFSMSRFKKDE